MKYRDMFFYVFLIAVFTALLILASGSIERISIHAMDTTAEINAKPKSVAEIITDNRQTNSDLSMWPMVMVFIMTSIVFIGLIGGVIYVSSPLVKNVNSLIKTTRKPTQRPLTNTQRQQSPYTMEPIEPIQLGPSGSDYNQLPQEVDTSWLE